MNDQKESPNTPPKPNVVALGSVGGLLLIVIAFAMTGRGGTEDAETIAKYIEPVARVEVAKAAAPAPVPAAPTAAPSDGGNAPAAEAPPPATEEPVPAAAEPQDPTPATVPPESAAEAQPAEATPETADAAPTAPVAAAPETTLVAAAGGADGKAVYNKICVMCHSTGVSGAPKLGDKTAWAPRIAQGMDTLVKSAISGKKLMPAKGGSPTLTDEQIRAAVEYMVSAGK